VKGLFAKVITKRLHGCLHGRFLWLTVHIIYMKCLSTGNRNTKENITISQR